MGVVRDSVMAMGTEIGILGKVPYPGGYQIRQLHGTVQFVQLTLSIVHTTTIRPKSVSGFPSIGFKTDWGQFEGKEMTYLLCDRNQKK